MFQGAEFSVGVGDTNFDGNGVELPGFADEFVLEGASEDEEFRGFEVEVRHYDVEK